VLRERTSTAPNLCAFSKPGRRRSTWQFPHKYLPSKPLLAFGRRISHRSPAGHLQLMAPWRIMESQLHSHTTGTSAAFSNPGMNDRATTLPISPDQALSANLDNHLAARPTRKPLARSGYSQVPQTPNAAEFDPSYDVAPRSETAQPPGLRTQDGSQIWGLKMQPSSTEPSFGSDKKVTRNQPASGTNIWRSEILCVLTSAVTFGGIIALLRIYQNQPTSRWQGAVSLNAAVAVLSAIFKASLVLPLTEGQFGSSPHGYPYVR
jgi:hypothetical protein